MWYSVLIILAACQPETLPPQESSSAVTASPQFADAWLSPGLGKMVITRMVGVASARYELDTTQQGKLRDAALKHWSHFVEKNHAQLRHLVSEFFEMSTATERPSKAHLVDWTHRVTPLLRELKREFNSGVIELRTHLNPSVRAKFDADVSRLDTELKISERQVQQWCADYFAGSAHGGLTEETEPRDGIGAPRNGKGPGEVKAVARDQRKTAASDQILIELDAWTIYVQKFMRTMDLDVGQRDAVLSVLSELKLRARAHRDRRREEIHRLERAIVSFQGSAEELQRLKQELIELYGPIDTMFGELRHRIEQVPTAAQQDKAKTRDH